MSPFIVCVNLPGCLPESDPLAYADLEETRDAAKREVEDADTLTQKAMSDLAAQCEVLTEQGGTIGPLPDGYVIDVQPVSWAALAKLAGIGEWRATARSANGRELARHERSGTRHTHAEILDAYNGGTSS